MIIPTSNQLASRLFSLLSAPFIVFFEIIDLESEVFPGAETETGFLPLKEKTYLNKNSKLWFAFWFFWPFLEF